MGIVCYFFALCLDGSFLHTDSLLKAPVTDISGCPPCTTTPSPDLPASFIFPAVTNRRPAPGVGEPGGATPA
jgi:hypothetical protein